MIFAKDLHSHRNKCISSKRVRALITGFFLLFATLFWAPVNAAPAGQLTAPILGRGLFAELPPEHWAYSAISSLIAAGLIPPDFKTAGNFDGIRPSTRYEAALYLQGLASALEQRAATPEDPWVIDPSSAKMIAALLKEFQGELAALGMRFSEVEQKLKALGQETSLFAISGDFRLTGESWGGLLFGTHQEEAEAPLPQRPFFGTLPQVGHELRLRFETYLGRETTVTLALKNQKLWGIPDADREANSDHLFTDEAFVRIATSRGLLTIGRQRFKLGPLGILAANPFDAFEGVQFESTVGKGRLSLVYNRQTADYAYGGRPLNYVYGSDEYLAARWATPGKSGWHGVNLLLSGLAGEMGASCDYKGLLWGKTAVVEVAGFKASPSSYDAFPGWVGAGLLSIDLLQGKDYLLNINVGSLSPWFTPMASNLGQAGGEIDLPRGSTGLQVNYSRLIDPSLVFDVETTLARPQGSPWEGNLLLKATKAVRQNTELEASYRRWFLTATNYARAALSLDYRF